MKVLALVAALGALAAPAIADTGPTSEVVQVMIVEPGDASYRLFHGAVWLGSDKETANYRWGGLQCKGRELSQTSIDLLLAGMRSPYQVTLAYVASELDGATYRCITSVTLSRAVRA